MFIRYHHHQPQASPHIHGSSKLKSPSAEHHAPNETVFPQFQTVSKTGVIYATSRATEHGFTATSEEWANMGQGAPETGPLPHAPSRNYSLTIPDDEIEYAPTCGTTEFREKVARYYNHLYRKGKDSQYTAKNVCVVPGGRAGLTRIMAALGHCQVGYFTPDYTAYEQCLSLFQRINSSPFLHRDMNKALMPSEEFEFQAVGRGVSAVLLSYPCNPSGQCLEGEQSKEYIRICKDNNIVAIMDEFYSHYFYDGTNVAPQDGGADDDSNWPKTVSSAVHIDDVNVEPVLIVNGLTKNWRCPGFRICWIMAPEAITDMLSSAGSFLDGGANAPLQTLALPLMELDFIRKDTWALQRHFRKKRDFLLGKLDNMGIKVLWKPTSTFYIWADLSALPPPLNDCLVFMEECVRNNVICVPGVFFDVNPGGIRNIKKSSCISHVRFSYGPPMRNLTLGMEKIEGIIQRWSKEHRRRSTVGLSTSSLNKHARN